MFNALTAPATKPVKVVCSFFGSVQWWFPNVSRFSRWDGSGEVLLERLRRHAFDNCPYHSCLTPLPTVSQYIISDPKSLGGSKGMKSNDNTKVQEHPRTPDRIQCTFCIFLLYPNFRWRACVFRRTLYSWFGGTSVLSPKMFFGLSHLCQSLGEVYRLIWFLHRGSCLA